MFIIEKNYDGDIRYFTSRRTWSSEPENAEEFETREKAWNTVNKIPGKLAYNRFDLDPHYSLKTV